MKLLLSLAALSLLVGCATAPKPNPTVVYTEHQMLNANWTPSGNWTDTDGRFFFLERCNHVTNGVACKSEWIRLAPAAASGTFPTNVPLPEVMLKQFYPPVPLPTRPKSPRDPLRMSDNP